MFPPAADNPGTGMRRFLPLVCALAAACSAPPLAESGPVEPAPDPPVEVRRRLAYHDLLRIDVYEHPELSSGELGRRIDYDGNVDLPLLGPVRVEGLTLAEAREALQQRADRYLKRASVAVSVMEYSPRLYYVMGEVQKSGPYEITRPTTALQALSHAGGLTKLADEEEIALLRVRDDELVVHLFNAGTPGASGFVPVEPNDLLFVRASGAGTFQDQIAPYLQGLAPPFAAAASLVLVADELND